LKQGVRVAGLGIFDHDHLNETLYWSPEMKAICGWVRDEPASVEGYVDMVHPEDRNMVATAIQKAHDPAGNGLYDVEHRIIRRDGSMRCSCIKAQTFFEGETTHVVQSARSALCWTSLNKNRPSNIANNSQ
jgi:PAS domain S-box-containing protein